VILAEHVDCITLITQPVETSTVGALNAGGFPTVITGMFRVHQSFQPSSPRWSDTIPRVQQITVQLTDNYTDV